ncbi:MAG: hypothetical protein ACLQBK_27350 [Candidatus Sulfotelmatobacter sp.]
MKKLRIVIMAFMAVSLTIWTSTTILAQQSGGPKTEAVKNAPTAVPRVSEAGIARELANNGRQLQDPYLLIQSAELMIAAGKLPGPKPEVKDEKPGSEKKISLDPADLLREAAKIAGAGGDHRAIEMAAEVARNATIGLGNESLADEISKTEVARGYSRGKHSWKGAGCLYSGQIAAQEFSFNKDEYAEIAVSTGQYLPVDVYVFDSYGLVNSDETSATDKTVAWHTGGDSKLKVALAANYGATCYGYYIP